jgi:hypothetical protein
MKQPNVTVVWPDLSRDQQAWELAKATLGPSASVREIANRAVDILRELKETK